MKIWGCLRVKGTCFLARKCFCKKFGLGKQQAFSMGEHVSVFQPQLVLWVNWRLWWRFHDFSQKGGGNRTQDGGRWGNRRDPPVPFHWRRMEAPWMTKAMLTPPTDTLRERHSPPPGRVLGSLGRAWIAVSCTALAHPRSPGRTFPLPKRPPDRETQGWDPHLARSSQS